MTFSSGASIIPFDYVNATKDNAVYLIGGVLKTNIAGATLTSVSQYAEAQKPWNPVAPSISITAPLSVGVCDGISLDARGATGGGSRALTYEWGVLTDWDAETTEEADSVIALQEKLVTTSTVISLGFGDLLAGRAYTFLIAAKNYLGETTTAFATVNKLGSPSPMVLFQESSIDMVRSDAKTLKLDVALPNLTCTDMNVSSTALGFVWRAWRLDGASYVRDVPLLSEYTANPVSCRLPKDALHAQTTYWFEVTVGFADTMTINNTAATTVNVGAQALVASIAGGVEQAVAIGDTVELDGSLSVDPDENDAEGPLRYLWNCSRRVDATPETGESQRRLVHDKSLLAPVDATQSILAFVPDTTSGWTGGATYEFTLLVSRGTRTATYSILLFISADRYMPRATVTDFDENLKYNPTADTYAAVYFEATSPDPDRYCCDSVWEVEGETINLLAKDAAAASPMLINLGLTRANAVYRLKLTVTDGIGSTSSSVVSLTTNGPPTSGTMAVTPYRGTALQTEFEFLLDAWSDDPDDYPLTYTYGYRQRLSWGSSRRRLQRGGASRGRRAAELAPLTPLVADQYASAWFYTTLPQADNVNITCVGRVFDRYLSFAEAYAPARVDALEMSTEDLSAFAGDLLSATADTGDGEASLSLISNVASVIGGDEETDANGTVVEKTPEQLAAEQALIDNLFAATIAAASQVGTGTSAAATSQVLSTVSTLSANPETLSEDSQSGALGLMSSVVGGASSQGIDPDTAASTASTVSSLLDASLFSGGGDADTELGGQMAGTVGGLATAMIAKAYGGQSQSVVSDNLELTAFRTDCGTRDSAFGLSTGGGVTGMPASAMDSAGGACKTTTLPTST